MKRLPCAPCWPVRSWSKFRMVQLLQQAVRTFRLYQLTEVDWAQAEWIAFEGETDYKLCVKMAVLIALMESGNTRFDRLPLGVF